MPDSLRLSDADRQEACELLGEQYAQGRLTREEFDERSDAVWSAKTHGDLSPVFADLPVGTPQQPPRPLGRAPRGPFRFGPLVGARRVLVPVLFVLVALTILTHLPLVLIAVGVWFFLCGPLRRRYRNYDTT